MKNDYKTLKKKKKEKLKKQKHKGHREAILIIMYVD
jgi:hypothetical protein